MGYFHPLGTALAKAGLVVFGHDHEGHGHSGGERVNIEDFQHYVDDVFDDIRQQTNTYSGLPIFIFGHSMGGTIALLATMERQHLFKGMVLTGPLVTSPDTHGPLSMFNRLLAKVATVFAPSLQAGTSLNYLVNTKEVARDKTVIRRMDGDPLFWKGQYKAKQTYAIFRALDTVNRQFGRVVTPLLVLHGSEDTIALSTGSRALVAGVRSKDKQFRELKGGKHHGILDYGGDEVIRSIVHWILARL